MSVKVNLTVNGRTVQQVVEARTLLSRLLREELGLTGTHIGCDTSQCGACTVLVDGEAVKSCTILAAQAEGSAVTTIEGLRAPDDPPHPMQQAFMEHHGLQCGFCTPGMILTSVALLERFPDPTEAQVKEGLDGNLCRCTGYNGIVEAVMACARRARTQGA